MNDILKTINYKGYEIRIVHDSNPMNPRTECDNLGTIVTWHRRYTLGDEQPNVSPDEWRQTFTPAVILPVYMYDHSGITLATTPFNCSWDSGQIGFIYVTDEKLKEEGHTNWNEEQVKQWLLSEIETYDQYLTGEVYGFEVCYGNELVESCYGFFGYDHEASGLIPDAKSNVDYLISQKLKAHFKELKAWVKNKVPHLYRKPAFQYLQKPGK